MSSSRSVASKVRRHERGESDKSKETKILPVQSEADIYAAIGIGRTLADALGFDPINQTKLETIVTELARNALRHGGGGAITFRYLERNGSPKGEVQRGLEITVEDHGPGIVDLAQALAGGHGLPGEPGLGIPSVRRLADEFAIDSIPERGTRVRVCKWKRVSQPANSSVHAQDG